MKRSSFPKAKRLVSNSQFKTVLERNLRVSNGLLTLFVADNDCGYPRVGISVAKACGNAVLRNRLKRLLREAFRQAQNRIPPGFDYLLMISPQWAKKLCDSEHTNDALKQLKFERIKSSFLALAARAAAGWSASPKPHRPKPKILD